MRLSIVIPAHNEGKHLERNVSDFIERLPAEITSLLCEVIIVENGSTDNTLFACTRLQRKYPHIIRIFSLSKGSYGEAIKKGMLESRGTHVCILECDFLDERFVVASSAVHSTNRADLVVGSKRHPDSLDKRPLKRRLLTNLYNRVFLNLLIRYPGTDTHGLKMIETSIARTLCDLAITTDEVFQTEIVLLAWRLGFRIEEVPIQINEGRSSPVSITRRLPKVVNTVQDLRRSLGRFEQQHSNGSESKMSENSRLIVSSIQNDGAQER